MTNDGFPFGWVRRAPLAAALWALGCFWGRLTKLVFYGVVTWDSVGANCLRMLVGF